MPKPARDQGLAKFAPPEGVIPWLRSLRSHKHPERAPRVGTPLGATNMPRLRRWLTAIDSACHKSDAAVLFPHGYLRRNLS